MLLGPSPNYLQRHFRPRNFYGHRAPRGSPVGKQAVWWLAGATVYLSNRETCYPALFISQARQTLPLQATR